MTVVLEERVSDLEYVLREYIAVTTGGMRDLQLENKRLSESLDKEAKRLDEHLQKEMKARDEKFQKEMKEKDEKWENDRKLRQEELQKELKARDEKWENDRKLRKEEFQKEMKVRDEKFQKEMKVRDEKWENDRKVRDEKFQNDIKESEKRMNKKWEQMVMKMGTLVEDIVAPSIKGVAFELFGFKRIDFFGVRVEKTKVNDRSAQREFDVIAVGDDKVILNETKSKPSSGEVKEFIDFLKTGEFYDYFPEYKEKKLIPIFSTLYMPPDVVKRLTKKRIFAMAMSETVMTVLNFEECRSRGLRPQKG
jgi:hypothetical protein